MRGVEAGIGGPTDVAVTVNETTAPAGSVVVTVISDGTVIIGPVDVSAGVVSAAGASKTVTVKLIVPTFPASSVAEQVTVVVPIGKL